MSGLAFGSSKGETRVSSKPEDRRPLHASPRLAGTADSSDLAFSPEPVPPTRRLPPVVIVGLPRSGSKYLTHVMNGIEGLFIFDDLYYFREARGIGARNPLTADQFAHLIGWLAGRSVFPEYIFFTHRPVSEDEVARLKDAVSQALQGREIAAHDLLEEWMIRYAMFHGCERWGYKAPQEFMYLDYVAEVFPGAQFIFLYRDPRKVMASYKYVSDRHGRANRYHPVTYALYWRLAQRTIASWSTALPIHRVKFEDLAAQPDRIGANIANFLGLRWAGAAVPARVNTSFDENRRREVTPTERWICQKLAGPEMANLGYAADASAARLRDVPDLLKSTVRSAAYHISQLVSNPISRKSAMTFVSRLTRRT